jgi:hypothetical protein
MTIPTEAPRTAAGRELLIRIQAFVYDSRVYDKPAAVQDYANAILAIEAKAAALPAAPAGLDVERLNLAAYRTPKLPAESMKEWLYRIAAAYAEGESK